MKNLFFFLGILLCTGWISCSPQKPADGAVVSGAANIANSQPPAEFADPKYSDVGKQLFALFAAKNIEGYLANFADDAVYRWNNGDSISGKAAIKDYWTKRWAETLDSITFHDPIFLPIQVNQPQSVERAGTWLLTWNRTEAKYKTGKTMTQWMHSDIHFNADDKIDEVIQYRDNALIAEAMKK